MSAALRSADLPWLLPARRRVFDFVRDDRVPHALMLAGPRGVGKALLALDIAGLLLCAAPAPDETAGWRSCGSCQGCRLSASGAHPDYVLLQPEEDSREIKVDQVRELIRRLTLTNTVGQRKVAVVMPAERMNRNAANALLKTLEEPQGDAVLILAASRTARLPATIRSRCQVITTATPGRAVASAWLQDTMAIDERLATKALWAVADAPLSARAFIESGELDSFQQLVNDLRGGDRAADVAERWKDQRVWPWLARWTAAQIRRHAGTDTAAAMPALKQLDQLYRDANRGEAMSDTAVRQDLLLLEWLLQWRRVQAEISQRRSG